MCFVVIQRDFGEKREQFVPVGISTVRWKTFPAKTMKISSTRNSAILMMSSSEYLFLESECSFTEHVFRGLIPNICKFGYRFENEGISDNTSESFLFSDEVRLCKAGQNRKT